MAALKYPFWRARSTLRRLSWRRSGKTWAANGDGAMKIIVGQDVEDAAQPAADFTDKDRLTKAGELRLAKASEEGMFAAGGTIRLPGSGAWAVTARCRAESES
jgi:hypothetical protein